MPQPNNHSFYLAGSTHSKGETERENEGEKSKKRTWRNRFVGSIIESIIVNEIFCQYTFCDATLPNNNINNNRVRMFVLRKNGARGKKGKKASGEKYFPNHFFFFPFSFGECVNTFAIRPLLAGKVVLLQ